MNLEQRMGQAEADISRLDLDRTMDRLDLDELNLQLGADAATLGYLTMRVGEVERWKTWASKEMFSYWERLRDIDKWTLAREVEILDREVADRVQKQRINALFAQLDWQATRILLYEWVLTGVVVGLGAAWLFR